MCSPFAQIPLRTFLATMDCPVPNLLYQHRRQGLGSSGCRGHLTRLLKFAKASLLAFSGWLIRIFRAAMTTNLKTSPFVFMYGPSDGFAIFITASADFCRPYETPYTAPCLRVETGRQTSLGENSYLRPTSAAFTDDTP